MKRRIVEVSSLEPRRILECYVCAATAPADPTPIGWESEIWHGDLRCYCPKHRKVDRPLTTLGELVRRHESR